MVYMVLFNFYEVELLYVAGYRILLNFMSSTKIEDIHCTTEQA